MSRKSYSEQEARQILESEKNGQGRKGVKAPRINMAFTLENYDFVVTMARMTGMSYTDFVNKLISEAKVAYNSQYQLIKKLRESL